MPRLWKNTIEEHRRDVRAAILDAAWRVAREHGVLSVTMGRVAEQAGIGRATVYKYFTGVDEILVAAHMSYVAEHLTHLEAARAAASSPHEGLRAVMEGYAQISLHRGRSGDANLDGLVHAGEEHMRAKRELSGLFVMAIRDAQAAGSVRNDVAPKELAVYAVHGLAAAGDLTSQAAVRRLVDLVESGLVGPLS